MSTFQLDIQLGASWKDDARCLAQLLSFQDPQEQFDYRAIVDTIDVVIDGTNITSKLPADCIFYAVFEFVTGLVLVGEGRQDKHIIAFHESLWELAIQLVHDDLQLSFYRVGPPREVPVHNVRAPRNRLANVVRRVAETMIGDLVQLNPVLRKEGTIRSFRTWLNRLAACQRESSALAPSPAIPAQAGPVSVSVGDRKLAIVLDFDATPDLFGYQGALDSDLHSLLFKGSLELNYWGRRRQVANSTYVFPIVEELVSGAERLLQLVKGQGGECTILEASDGADGVITVAVADPERMTVQITDDTGAVGRTKTTPEQLFNVLVDSATATLGAIVQLNPRQRLNRRINALDTRIDHLKGQFVDVRRGDIYLDNESDFLDTMIPVRPCEEPQDKKEGLPYPMEQLRHLFLRPSWHLTRPMIDFDTCRLVQDQILLPSRSRFDCISLQTGAIHWSAPSERLLAHFSQRVLLYHDGQIHAHCRDQGEISWRRRSSAPTEVTPFWLGNRAVFSIVYEERGLVVVDASTGQSIWDHKLEHGEIVGVSVAGPVLVVLADDGFAHGLAPNSGEPLWRVRVPGCCVFPPMFHDNRLLLCADSDSGLEGILLCLSPFSGRKTYERWTPVAFSRPPTLIDGVGLLTLDTTNETMLVAIDLSKGHALWLLGLGVSRLDGPVYASFGAKASRSFVIKGDDGVCQVVDLQTGRLRWSFEALPPNDIVLRNLPPIVVEDHLLVANKHIAILNSETGNLRHRLADMPEHPTFLALDGNFRLVVGEEEDQLGCFDMTGFLALLD